MHIVKNYHLNYHLNIFIYLNYYLINFVISIFICFILKEYEITLPLVLT